MLISCWSDVRDEGDDGTDFRDEFVLMTTGAGGSGVRDEACSNLFRSFRSLLNRRIQAGLM